MKILQSFSPSPRGTGGLPCHDLPRTGHSVPTVPRAALMNEGSSAIQTTPVGPLVGPSVREIAVPGARHALLLLVLINLFNYIDRQVLAAVEPHIRAEFFPPVGGVEPENAKELTGFLSFAFLATYML